MLKFTLIISLVVILGAGVFISGCRQTALPAPSAPAPPAAGEVAAAGQTVFTSRCAGCHGATGGGGNGPAIIGAGALLGKYNTAQGLFDFVATAMPAKAPGSLPHQDYLNVVSYLLVQNNFLPADAAFVESRLGDVSLK